MKRVLLLATTTGYQIRSFGEAADRLGVRLVFASDRCDQLDDPWWDHAIPIRFHELEPSIEAIVEACNGAPVDAVIAVGDRPAVLAASVAHALGLPGNPRDAANTSRSKLASRRAFRAAGLLTPSFTDVSINDDPVALAATCAFPAVIKPLALSGSRGVMRVDDEGQFVEAFDRLRRLLQSMDILSERDDIHSRALIESYIPGDEYAIEGVVTGGVFQCFTIFDKPDPLVGPYFEETLYVTPSRASKEIQGAIVEHTSAAVRALGLTHGPVHAECRVNQQGIYVLEVAPRPIGGLCSKAVRLRDSMGALLSLEEALLRHALGDDVSRITRDARASGVLMIPIPKRGILRSVGGVDAARAIAGVDDVHITAKADERLIPLPEGRSYLGFVFASGDRPFAVEQSLRDAHAQLTFTIDREIEVATPGR